MQNQINKTKKQTTPKKSKYVSVKIEARNLHKIEFLKKSGFLVGRKLSKMMNHYLDHCEYEKLEEYNEIMNNSNL